MKYKRLLPHLAEELSKKAYQQALQSIRSKQLRRTLSRVNVSDSVWKLHIPQYWAVYLHDGRGPVSPKAATFLVWFRNPKNDPRLSGGQSPLRAAQTRRLSKSQFQYWARKNQAIIKKYRARTGKKILTSSDYEAMKLPMVVVKMSPKNGGRVPGQHFFDNDAGMQGFSEQVSRTVKRSTSDHVKKELTKFGILKKKQTLIIR